MGLDYSFGVEVLASSSVMSSRVEWKLDRVKSWIHVDDALCCCNGWNQVPLTQSGLGDECPENSHIRPLTIELVNAYASQQVLNFLIDISLRWSFTCNKFHCRSLLDQKA